jgi:vitamin B12/bleomycin/antimicrobial peptide transport system ATP-binding/permease protein
MALMLKGRGTYSELEKHLNDVAPSLPQLSPGEQQRIAFIRILLRKPDWVFLDESTSVLELDYERQMYNLLKTSLLHCS